MQSIRDNAADDIILGLIGNKIDLADKRVINKERGEELGNMMGLKLYESSAKTKDNVNDLFQDIIVKVIKYKKSEEASQNQNDEANLRLKSPGNEKKKKICAC